MKCPNCGSNNTKIFILTRRNYPYGKKSKPRYSPTGKYLLKCFKCGYRTKEQIDIFTIPNLSLILREQLKRVIFYEKT